MYKKILIGSILAVALLTLVSFSNVVGYNTIKTSQEELIESEYSFDECKDYLFETLVEISENPDIKEIIKSNYKPQRTMLPFRRSNVDLKVEHLELLYDMGLKIMDILGEERVEELMENIEIPDYSDELDTIIMGNDELRERIYTLSKMNNEEIDTTDFEDKPIICGVLGVILFISLCFVTPINFLTEYILIPLGAYYLSWFIFFIFYPFYLIGLVSAYFYIFIFFCWELYSY